MTIPWTALHPLPSIKINSSNWGVFYSILDDNLGYSIALLLEKPDLKYIDIGDLATITIDEKNKEENRKGSRCRIDLTKGNRAEITAESVWNLLGRIILKEYDVKCSDNSFFSDYFSFNYLMRNYFMKISPKGTTLKKDLNFRLKRSWSDKAAIKKLIYDAANNIHAEIDSLIKLWGDLLKFEEKLDPTYLISNGSFETKLFESAGKAAQHIHLDYFAKECVRNINAIVVLYFISNEEHSWSIDCYNEDQAVDASDENVCSFFRVSYYSLLGKHILLDNELSTYLSEGRKNLFIDLFADKLSKGGYKEFFNKMDRKIKDDPALSKMPVDEAKFFIRYAFVEYAYKLIKHFHDNHKSVLASLRRYSC